MLDTVKFCIPMDKTIVRRVFARKGSQDEQGKARPYKFRRIGDKKLGYSCQVLPGNNGEALIVEVSLARVVQGHNVVGRNSMKLLCREITRVVHRSLGLKMTADDKRRINKMHFDLGRVDVTGHFEVGSQINVVAVLNNIRLQLIAQGFDIVVHEGRDGVETIYLGKSSGSATLKFYNKYLELLHRPLPEALPYRDEILMYAKKLVRVEFTLRKPALESRKLDCSNFWSKDLVRELLVEQLGEFKWSGNLKSYIDPKDVKRLKPADQMIYNFWWEGADIKKHMAPKSYQRYLEKFSGLGINIGLPPANHKLELSLKDLLAPDTLLVTWPKHLREVGAIYGTTKGETKPKVPESESRKEELQVFLEAIETGNQWPTDRQFKSYLTAAAGAYYSAEICSRYPKVPRDVKQYLRPYCEEIRTADFLYWRAENLPRSHWKGRSKLYARAETEYEKAFEHLEEVIGMLTDSRDPRILDYLDRDPDLEHNGQSSGSNTSPCPAGAPRLIDSRSPYNLARAGRREFQLSTLRLILECIEDGTEFGVPSQIQYDDSIP